MNLNIYKKEYNNDTFNYLAISISYPTFKFGKYKTISPYEDDSPYRKYALTMDSEISYYSDNVFIQVCFKILGFGIYIERQQGY